MSQKYKMDGSVPEAFGKVGTQHVRLGTFIRASMMSIVDEWSRFARTRTPASDKMTAHALKDHIEDMLTFIADDLETSQTSAEQVSKSQGMEVKEEGSQHSAAEIHAGLRLIDGFDIDQMVSEYRALRASVTKLWITQKVDLDREDLNDLIRFNEGIDQSVAESISHYTRSLDRSRNIVLGILGHDLRSPIGAASMAADVLARSGVLNARDSLMASQIKDCTLRAALIIDDLLDLTRIQFGSNISISRSIMDISLLSRQLVDEMQILYPGRIVELQFTGDMNVDWDRSRLGQVLSNLIGNAMTYGSQHSPINLTITGDLDQLSLTVKNIGKPISPEDIKTIFDLFKQGTGDNRKDDLSSHLGLGLYITREIVTAHGGTISVTSNEKDGTEFTAVIPRNP